MADQDFVHLHVHTEYSLLDGLSRVSKLVERAKELGQNALAISDHGAMFGVINFYKACKAAGVKPIIGMEGYLAPRTMRDRDPVLDRSPFHLLMLAANETGYKNLLKIASAAQLEGYYYKPRIDRDFLAAHSEGLIVTSGCLAGQIPSLVVQERDREARDLLDFYVQTFGRDRFFLELQSHAVPELDVVNHWLVETGHRDNVRLIATNDVHYVLEDDHDIHDTLLCIQTSTLKSADKRMRMSDNSYFLTSAAQMDQIFGHIRDGEALKNTLLIADMCEDLHLDKQVYHLPVFPVPEGFTSETYLRHLCLKGLEWRYGERAHTDADLLARLDHELGIITRMQFPTYFLIVWDLCEFARHHDIWWNVRGSGAGSVAAYALGITSIDPLQNGLLFERFLHEGRLSMPDIDMDFQEDRRNEMIAYTVRKYGEERVAAIITFGTLGPKAAFRDVGRALGADLALVNQAAGMIPTEPKPKALKDYIEANPDLQRLIKNNPVLQQVTDTVARIQGMTRHPSTHAAGIIVADLPLVEYLPLHRQTKNDDHGPIKQVTQFPMETAESIGLLKVDFLGLSTLSAMRLASDLIQRHHGIRYTMENIPYQPCADPELERMRQEALATIRRGETVGVFQFESKGMQQMLREMRPSQFEHLVAAVALYRPGPMDYIPMYSRRMHGEEAIDYKHPALAPILNETYSIIVYQEQIMEIAHSLFGYSMREADEMRKAVSKKKDKDLAKHRKIFVDQGPNHGVDAEVANLIFDDIDTFANYGFNKSHAADYAMIALQTAFLKTHYPAEFMAAMLTTYFDDTFKVTTFLAECKRMNIPILPPDINASGIDFDIEALPDGRRGIRFGLAAIKNAGVGAMEVLLSERANGPFADVSDLAQRVDLRSVGKRALESLARVGVFESLGVSRPALLAALDRLLTASASLHKASQAGQASLFGDSPAQAVDLMVNMPPAEDVPFREILNWEKELVGLYISSHPIDPIMDELQGLNLSTTAELCDPETDLGERPVRIVGLITSLRKVPTKSGDMMAIAQLEDRLGTIEAVAFPRTWAKIQDVLQDGAVVYVAGKLDLKRGSAQIVIDHVTREFKALRAEIPDEAGLPPLDDWRAAAPPTATNGTAPEFPAAATSSTEPPLFDDPTPDWGYQEPEAPPPPPAQSITITFPRNGDPVKDSRRLRRLIETLLSYPGQDSFLVLVTGGQNGSYEMRFPNQTRCCPPLMATLTEIVGEANIALSKKSAE